MSTELSLLTIDTTALQETVGQMCAGHDRLDAFLRGLFGELDALSDGLTRHGRRIDSTKQDQEAQCAEHEERLGRERQELESTFEQIQKLTDQLGESAAASSSGSGQLQEVLAGIEEQRSCFQIATEASESRDAELARMADELAAARQDVAEAREELRSQRELLSQAPAQSENRADPEILERLARLEQERLAWTQERAVLETELDSVRTRAAELTDTLDGERQQVSDERKNWADELRQMRQLLESLSDQSAAPARAVVEAAPKGVDPDEEGDAQDPVLDSVMAQFEILQKDLARRRKAKPASK